MAIERRDVSDAAHHFDAEREEWAAPAVGTLNCVWCPRISLDVGSVLAA
jgi:hypothetical protein